MVSTRRDHLFLLFAVPALSLAQNHSGKRPLRAGAFTCPDDVARTGKYTNYSYAFRMTIPRHTEGFWNSTPCVKGPRGCGCMSDHGLVIPLTLTPDETERHIEVYATHGPTDETTLATKVEARLVGIRERSRQRSLEIRNRS